MSYVTAELNREKATKWEYLEEKNVLALARASTSPSAAALVSIFEEVLRCRVKRVVSQRQSLYRCSHTQGPEEWKNVPTLAMHVSIIKPFPRERLLQHLKEQKATWLCSENKPDVALVRVRGRRRTA